ncbi:MAG: CesT family type III secretion system chaperone [Pseudomonadota bacterium]
MRELLQSLKLPPLATTAKQDVYTLYFEANQALHVLNAKDSQVEVLSEAGNLANLQDANTLLGLLELNSFSGTSYSAGVTVHRETGMVIVRCRQPLASLDVAAMIHLLRSVRHQVDVVRQLLNKPVIRSQAHRANPLSKILNLRQ